MHVVAPKTIHSLADLDGKKVAVDLPNGGTFVTSMRIFERLGIHPNYAFIEQRIAYEKLGNGEIDAVVAVRASPRKSSRRSRIETCISCRSAMSALGRRTTCPRN
jgi:TRAP-type uncharacterized transport system substrate-binding protein